DFGLRKPREAASIDTIIKRLATLIAEMRATTHISVRKELPEAAFVTGRDDVVGRVITEGGVSVSIDLGLKILEMNFGRELADEVAARIEYVVAPGKPATA